MMRYALTLTALFLATPALAADYTYMQFEASVTHIDLDECPAALAEGDVFCRATINHDALHVYVFEAGGEQRFVDLHSYDEDEFDLVLQAR